MSYKIYITDSLKCISNNTSRYAGGEVITMRFVDLVNPRKQDNRTGDEIVEDIIKRAGLVVKPD